MASRFYFYTMDGKEIETELSKKGISHCSSAIVEMVDGKWKMKMYETKHGEVFSRDEIGVFERGYQNRDITIRDFEGHEMVLVKHWTANPQYREWFILTELKEGEDLACNVKWEA